MTRRRGWYVLLRQAVSVAVQLSDIASHFHTGEQFGVTRFSSGLSQGNAMSSPGGTVPIGFSFAFAEAILISPKRSAHPGLASGMLVSARRSRSASQSIRARASSTIMKIFRNGYMAILGLVQSIQSKQ